MKLGAWQENFKVTLQERPPEKSCSTLIYGRNPSNLKNFWQLPNFIEFLNPQKFRLGESYDKLAKIERLNYNLWILRDFKAPFRIILPSSLPCR